MRRLNVGIAVVAIGATVAMLGGFIVKNTVGDAATDVISLSVIAATVAAVLLFNAPIIFRWLRLRRAAARLGLRLTEWVMPQAKADKRFARDEPWVYVSILHAAEEIGLNPGMGVYRATAALDDLSFQKLAGRDVVPIVYSLVNTFTYPQDTKRYTLADGPVRSRSLATRTAECLREQGSAAVLAFFSVLYVEDALDAMEAGLPLEYAQEMFQVPAFISAYSRA